MRCIVLVTFLILLVGCKVKINNECNEYDIYQQGIKIDTTCDCVHVSRSFADDGVFYKYLGKCKKEK